MILEIKKWCEGIIIAIVISIIIEMIIPDGKNKKYIKVIIGVYILFVSLSPILEFIKYDFKIDKILSFETSKTFQTDNETIKDIYIAGIEETIKIEIEELGYIVKKVKVILDSNYEEIKSIELKIDRNNQITPIIISENKEWKDDYKDIIELIEKNYFVDSSNIIFK